MNGLQITLFGRFQIRSDRGLVAGFESKKTQELLSYLLMYRLRAHHREALAYQLWGENCNGDTKKHLRQTLWQLQSAINRLDNGANVPLLVVDTEFIGINPRAQFTLDVKQFEQAYASVRDVPGHQLDDDGARSLQQASILYRADLLEGWYQEWCLFERERLRSMYLSMQGKLMGFCEARGEYELSIAYGNQILRFDRAHERTHQRLLRLYCLLGDRTMALRQYDRCCAALREELDVKPTQLTHRLYERICADEPVDSIVSDAPAQPDDTAAGLGEMLGHLKQMQEALKYLQGQMRNYTETTQTPS
jgi:DNA-binding SARP family transcriptional activator